MAHNKTTIEIESEIVKRYMLGFKVKDISIELDISRSTILNIARRNNLPIRKRQKQDVLNKKICLSCKIIKPIKEFSIVTNRKHSNTNSRCKECNNTRMANHRNKNLNKLREYQRNWAKQKRQTNPQYKIAQNLRRRVREVINFKSSHTEELLNCSFEFFIKYLESKFESGMTWDNYGNKKNQWNIDHIKPCDSFNLLDPEQQRICFNYNNLRPMWSNDNFSKKNKIA